MKEINVRDLKAMRDRNEDFMLLDVREPDEIATASIAWATAIPMGDVAQRLAEIPADKTIAVLCHGGGRSARVTAFLNENGYADAVNVGGGIRAWSAEIDPTVPDY